MNSRSGYHFAVCGKRLSLGRYEFCGFHGTRAHCSLEILYLGNSHVVVIATEAEDNSATSVISMAETLAERVCADFKIEFAKVIWIEKHYQAIGRYSQATFFRVWFRILPPEYPVALAFIKRELMTGDDWLEILQHCIEIRD